MYGDLKAPLDPSDDAPPYRQIVDRVWYAVASGDLDAGAKLPTARQLAIDLGVHPDTVTRAYNELELLGAVVQHSGEGTYVGLRKPNREEFERRGKLEKVCREAIARAGELEFSLQDLLDNLAAFRESTSNAESQER